MPVRIRNVSMKPVLVSIANHHDIYLDPGSVSGVMPDDVAEDHSVANYVSRRMLKVEKLRARATPEAAGKKPVKKKPVKPKRKAARKKKG
jgi:hypothetical protein